MTTTATPITADDAAAANPDLSSLRLGRIAYINSQPMHWRLGIEPTLTAPPTALNQALVDGEIDAACISSIEYARNAESLVLLPSMCISSAGAVGSIKVFSNKPFEQVTHFAVTPESATSVALVECLSKLRGGVPEISVLHGSPEEFVTSASDDQARGVLLIGDAALAAADSPALSNFFSEDLGERWHRETGLPMVYAVWAVRREVAEQSPELTKALDEALCSSVHAFATDDSAVKTVAGSVGMTHESATEYFNQLCYRFAQAERKGMLRFLRMASEYGLLDTVPTPQYAFASDGDDNGYASEMTFESVRKSYGAAVGSPSVFKVRPQDEEAAAFALQLEDDARQIDVDAVLQKALDETRINEVEATALLQSDRLVDIGRVANELRCRRTNPDEITFVVDRNINYTNLCVTDCGFCAFYRRPNSEATDAYLHSNDEILRRIQETVDLGGTAALMQGGHHPNLDINWYIELFNAVREKYPRFHMHALSPPEIQHIARRSKLTTAEVLSQLRDAGLDSLPGGGGEILVDRARHLISPKKTKGHEWLAIMREAQRMGMSTTASMMYGHIELLSERVLHMKLIRDLQDETAGFRAFISWTFQKGNTPLARLVDSGFAPYAEHLPAEPTAYDYLLTQAVSRIYLDNVENIQSSWVTQGLKVGQVALHFGANDMGSIMIEENVVSSAGTTHRATTEDFVKLIRQMEKVPVQRDTFYRTVKVW